MLPDIYLYISCTVIISGIVVVVFFTVLIDYKSTIDVILTINTK